MNCVLDEDAVCKSITLESYSSALDIDGFNIDCDGEFIVGAGCTVQDTSGGGLIEIASSLSINGESGSSCVWNGPDIDLETDVSTVSYTTVTNSDASAGFEIDASDGTNTDVSGNSNWDFGGAPSSVPYWVFVRNSSVLGGGLA